MRPLWKGAISFGLVNIPVRLYAATENREIRFRFLHQECATPINYLRWCPHCRREVPREDIVRGFEYGRGEFVLMRSEELESLPLPSARSVEILDFVELDEIDPVFFDRTYYLEPAEGGVKAYALLRKAMAETNRVGIAKVAIRTRESLAAIRPFRDRALVLETMHYPDEIRSLAPLAGVGEEPEVGARETEMARMLISSLSDRFEPEKYRNEYREALQRVIEEKVEGRQVKRVEPPEPAKVVDLMEALRESVRLAEKRRAPLSDRTPEQRVEAR